MRGIVILSGTSHPILAELIASRLGTNLGDLKLKKFANAEIGVEIFDSVRDKDVYIIQTGSGDVSDHLLELFILIHACKMASAARITAVLPYSPYTRTITRAFEKPLEEKIPLTDRQKQLRSALLESPDNFNGYTPWAARPGRLVASMIEAAGADHVFTLDLHNAAFQGFFDIPLDNLPVAPLMIKHILENIADCSDSVIISPDAGGTKRATDVANRLGCHFALIHTPIDVNKNEKKEGMRSTVIGNVKGKRCIIIDDLADTLITLSECASTLKVAGAELVYAVVSHGIFSADSIDLLNRSEIAEIYVSNSVDQTENCLKTKKIHIIDISPLLSEAIRRAHNGESISYLFTTAAFP